MADKRNREWIVECEDGNHTVSLIYEAENADFAIVYIDGRRTKTIRVASMFNFEYCFNVCEKQCSIVKLNTEKQVRFSVDQKYVDSDDLYVKIPKVPLVVNILMLINLIVLIVFTGYNIFSSNPFVIGIFGLFFAFIILGLPIKYIGNYPYPETGNVNKFKKIKTLVITISEILYLATAVVFWIICINNF